MSTSTGRRVPAFLAASLSLTTAPTACSLASNTLTPPAPARFERAASIARRKPTPPGPLEAVWPSPQAPGSASSSTCLLRLCRPDLAFRPASPTTAFFHSTTRTCFTRVSPAQARQYACPHIKLIHQDVDLLAAPGYSLDWEL